MMDGKVTAYAALREADISWERRVWRVIDLHDPVNQVFHEAVRGPAACYGLWDIIRHGLRTEGTITAYDPGPQHNDDAFKLPYTHGEITGLLEGLDSLSPASVTRFMIKEDWLFDKQRSVMEVRIIGLAPMLEILGRDGELRGYRPLFWLYFPECRTLLARWLAFVDERDGSRLSYDRVFAERRFSSTIDKVGNVMDRRIGEHGMGLDALLESEDIRQQLFLLGFDLWHY